MVVWGGHHGQCGIRRGEYGCKYVDRYLKKNLQAIAEKLGICQTFKICQNCDPNIKQSVNCNIIKKLQNHADDWVREGPIPNKKYLMKGFLE